MPASNVRNGSEAEVGSYPGVTAVSTSGLVILDRHRRSSQPAHALGPVVSIYETAREHAVRAF